MRPWGGLGERLAHNGTVACPPCGSRQLAHTHTCPCCYGLVTSSVFSAQDAWDCYRSQGAYAGGKSDSASFETLPLGFTDNGHWHHLVLTTKGHGKGMNMYIDGKLEATHPRGLNCEDEAGGCIGLDRGGSDPSRYFNANGVGGEPIDPVGDMRLCGRLIGGAITNTLSHTGDEDVADFDPLRYFHGQVAHFAVWDSPLSHHQVNALLEEYRLMYRLPKDLSPGNWGGAQPPSDADWESMATVAGDPPPRLPPPPIPPRNRSRPRPRRPPPAPPS